MGLGPRPLPPPPVEGAPGWCLGSRGGGGGGARPGFRRGLISVGCLELGKRLFVLLWLYRDSG